jgi:hypothetical protein
LKLQCRALSYYNDDGVGAGEGLRSKPEPTGEADGASEASTGASFVGSLLSGPLARLRNGDSGSVRLVAEAWFRFEAVVVLG